MKPIIFSTEMVRAILDGRKTQTRRVIKPQPDNVTEGKTPMGADYMAWYNGAVANPLLNVGGCSDLWPPYRPGQILWVRETWGIPIRMAGEIIYRADYADKKAPLADGEKWRPSIHMPREAARIFLRVIDVRVERLQEITEEDARAEGCDANIPDGVSIIWFYEIWNRLNARRGYGWDVNPWVWVIEFERTEAPL